MSDIAEDSLAADQLEPVIVTVAPATGDPTTDAASITAAAEEVRGVVDDHDPPRQRPGVLVLVGTYKLAEPLHLPDLSLEFDSTGGTITAFVAAPEG